MMREMLSGTQCPKCGAISSIGGLECCACGHHWYAPEETLEDVLASVPDDDDPIREALDALDVPMKEYTLVVYADGAGKLYECMRDSEGRKTYMISTPLSVEQLVGH